MENRIEAAKGILFDLDGVLYVGSQAIAGAVEAVSSIQNSGIPCRFITNTSTLSVSTLQQKLHQLGFTFAINSSDAVRVCTILCIG